MWVYLAGSGNTRTLVGNLQSPATQYVGWEIALSSGVIDVHLINNYGGGNYIEKVTTAQLSLNALHHVAFTYDGSKTAAGVKIYIDGVLAAASAIHDALTGSIVSTQNVFIGARMDGTIPLINGTIQAVRIYNRALTATDITNYFPAGVR
jgi:hypothetical protein